MGTIQQSHASNNAAVPQRVQAQSQLAQMPPNSNLINNKNLNLQAFLNKQIAKNNIKVNQQGKPPSAAQSNERETKSKRKNPMTTQNQNQTAMFQQRSLKQQTQQQSIPKIQQLDKIFQLQNQLRDDAGTANNETINFMNESAQLNLQNIKRGPEFKHRMQTSSIKNVTTKQDKNQNLDKLGNTLTKTI